MTHTCHLLAYGLKQTEPNKTSIKRRALPNNTTKYYIIVIKIQIYVQTKENSATDPLQTHTSRKNTGNTQHTIKANKQRLTVTHEPKQTHLNI